VADRPDIQAPGFGLTLFSILLPVLLMLLDTFAQLALPKTSAFAQAARFIGHPTIALLTSVLFASWSLGLRCGYAPARVMKFTEESIAAIGMTLLVVGGGGGFAAVLRTAGVADAMGRLATDFHLPPLVYAWMVAAFVRVATGSATVSITVGSGLLADFLTTAAASGAPPLVNIELAIIALGCGSLFLSHLNDGGFWIVKDCLGLTVSQTLKTWTVTETIVGIAGLIITLGVHAVWVAMH